MTEKDNQMSSLKEQYDAVLQNLHLREDRIVDLEFELLSCSQMKSTTKRTLFTEKADTESEKDKSFYLKEIQEKDYEIERLHAEIIKLNGEVKKRTGDLQGLVNKELWEKNRLIEKLENRHAAAIETKEKQILELKTDVSSRDMQLKVLKDKICELGIDIYVPKDHLDAVSQMKFTGNSGEDVKALQEQLKVLLEEREYFEVKIKELEEKAKLSADDEKVKFIERLKEDISSLQKEYEHSEKLRFETNEICSVLSSRLEELAIFLDSLLKQKSVLGFLGSSENKKLRQIIDQSLDLSRTFAVSMLNNPEQSLMQLSNLSNIFNNIEGESRISLEPSKIEHDSSSWRIIPDSVTLTYHSHLYASSASEKRDTDAHVINTLRQQIENLKYELQLRDTELNRLNELFYQQRSDFNNDDNCIAAVQGTGDITSDVKCENATASNINTSATLKYHSENQSESEAWSEPDRSVSKARIGLETDSRLSSGKRSSRLTTYQVSSDSTEDNSSRMSLSKTPSKKSMLQTRQTIIELHRKICELESKVIERDNKLIMLEENNFEVKKLLQEEQISHHKLKVQLENLTLQIKDAEQKAAKAEERKAEAEKQIETLQHLVDELKLQKQKSELHLEGEMKVSHDRINTLEEEKAQAIKRTKEFEKEVKIAKNELESAENKLTELHKNMDKLRSTLQEEYKEEMIKKLKYAEEQFSGQLEMAQKMAENEIKSLKERMKEMEVQYEQDYIKKCEVDKKISEVDIILQQNATLKEVVSECEENIKHLQLRDHEQTQKLSEFQDKVSLLRRELDNATLQYSEAVLEKTKIANEKAFFEQELNKVNYKENEMKQQITEIQAELLNVKENYQKQVSILQDQKLKLEVKISELESVNAELHNRLISLRTMPAEQIYSTSLPSANSSLFDLGIRNIPVNHLVNYKRQCSDNSGYTSEEHQVAGSKDIIYPFNRPSHLHLNVPVDLERHEANSSPDLGIESDHGRFSSLEAQLNIPRPLLQTLELTESMSNLLDAENNQIQNLSCDNEHCCKKTLEMASENSDLKKKLLRTRRALEETVTQLTLANQRKKQVEKTICKQIHKTSQVLRKAKANLDSGSETDVYKK